MTNWQKALFRRVQRPNTRDASKSVGIWASVRCSVSLHAWIGRGVINSLAPKFGRRGRAEGKFSRSLPDCQMLLATNAMTISGTASTWLYTYFLCMAGSRKQGKRRNVDFRGAWRDVTTADVAAASFDRTCNFDHTSARLFRGKNSKAVRRHRSATTSNSVPLLLWW